MSPMRGFARKYAYTLSYFGRLLTFGMLSGKNRAHVNRLYEEIRRRPALTPPVIPSLPLADLVPDDTPVQMREALNRNGNISVFELVALNKLIRRIRPARLFEIGTFDGRTALNMAANAPDGAVVFTLDLPGDRLQDAGLPLDSLDLQYIEKPGSGSRFLGTDCERKIVQLYGDSATFDFSDYAGSIDFVFVDGSHSYEYVLNDSRRALQICRNVGPAAILWHDYGTVYWDGVTRALNELYGEREFSGLRRIAGTSMVLLLRGTTHGGEPT
jgi:SAM-dependent methyltransferase